jgi:hypothetical protein
MFTDQYTIGHFQFRHVDLCRNVLFVRVRWPFREVDTKINHQYDKVITTILYVGMGRGLHSSLLSPRNRRRKLRGFHYEGELSHGENQNLSTNYDEDDAPILQSTALSLYSSLFQTA